MYCSTCGKQNPGNARYCTSCGQPAAATMPTTSPSEPPYTPQGNAPTGHIPDYLVQAILVTICCCIPFGVVSIAYAAQVNGKVGNGDFTGAKRDSENAKKWAWISFGVGIPVNLLFGWLWL